MARRGQRANALPPPPGGGGGFSWLRQVRKTTAGLSRKSTKSPSTWGWLSQQRSRCDRRARLRQSASHCADWVDHDVCRRNSVEQVASVQRPGLLERQYPVARADSTSTPITPATAVASTSSAVPNLNAKIPSWREQASNPVGQIGGTLLHDCYSGRSSAARPSDRRRCA